MKKLFTILCVAVFTFSVSAQTQYGATLGLNMSNVTGDDAGFSDPGMKNGIRLGLSMSQPLSDVVKLNTGIIYSVKGTKYQELIEYYDIFGNYLFTDYDDGTATLSYIEIPVNFGFAVSDKFSLLGGFYSAFLIDATLESETLGDRDASENTSAIDFGLGFGAEVYISEKLSISAGYQMGLSTIDDTGAADVKNQNVLLGITFNFGR